MGNFYDDDNYATKQTLALHLGTYVDVDDNEVIARVKFFNKVKLLNVQAIVRGTIYDAATCTILLYKDNGSIGEMVISTATINQVIDASLTETTFDTTNTLEIQLGNESATGLCDVMIQYQELFE